MSMSPENISVERANLTHVDGILKLAEANSPGRGGELTGSLPRDAVVAAIQMLPAVVAIRGGQVAGFLLSWEKSISAHPCVAAMLNAYAGSDDAYVYGPICVEASLRGRGLAAAMFAELRRLIPGREGILFIKANNTPSIRAHLKMGMRKTAEYTWDGRPFLVFAYDALGKGAAQRVISGTGA